MLAATMSCSAQRPPTTVGVPPLREYRALHERYVAMAARDAIDVLFIGDSITFQWSASAVWKTTLAPLGATDFSVPGDGTREVLWRVANGELIGVKPKVVVLLIGGNDVVGGDAPQAVRDGVIAVIAEIQRLLPTSRILLLGILPTGQDLIRWNDAIRRTNELVMSSRPQGVRWLDLGPSLGIAYGGVPVSLMSDGQHPSPLGFELATAELVPVLKELLATAP